MKKNIIFTLFIICNLLITTQSYGSEESNFMKNLSRCQKSTFDNGNKITVISGIYNRRCYITEITSSKTSICILKHNDLIDFTNILKQDFDYKKGFASSIDAKKYLGNVNYCRIIDTSKL